jgi:endonuclease/exonuclease/phosphatase family metal-dependent hydrolase
MDGRRATRASTATTVVLTLSVALLAPVTRVLFPRLYLFGEDASFLTAGGIGLLVYCAPILALALPRVPDRTLAWFGLGLLGGARLAVQFVHPVPGWVAIAATGVSLVGVASLLAGLGGLRSLRLLPVGLMGGLALDTALRLPTGSWEPVWQQGPIPGLAAITSVAVAAAAMRVAVLPPIDDAPGISGAAVAAVGPFLMLQLMFLQNLGGVGSAVPVSFPGSIAVVLAGDVLALCAAALVAANRHPLGLAAAVFGGVAATAIAWRLPSSMGVSAVVGALVLQVLATACLTLVALRPVAAGRSRVIVTVTVAALGFLLLSLSWQLHVDMPLPFPRSSVPAIAAVWLAVASVRSVSRRPAVSTAIRPVFTGAALVTASALTVGVVTAVTWPSRSRATPSGPRITIATFNVRGGLGEDGMIDADAIADSIRSTDADVVLLQEVARGWPIFGQYDLLARLSQRLGTSYRYEPAADAQFGNAVFSRLPMSPAAAGPLPQVDGKQTRSYLAVRVLTSAGPLLVVDAHLESDSAVQIDALLEVLDGASPAVVGGDMNMQTTDTADVHRFVAAGMVDAEGATGDACRTTSAAPTSNCDRPDWVWVSQDLTVTAFETGRPSSSDHLPVVVSVTMP